MRFVAAALVVVFHISQGDPFMLRVPLVLRNIIDGGFVWVGFFFVLSGFILSYQYFDRVRAGRFDTRDFLLARFARIYPGHFVGFIVMAALFAVKSWDISYPAGGPVVMSADVFATLSLAHAWIPSFALTFNFPSWSISTEFFFYLCFPVLAVMAIKWPLRQFLLLAGAVFIVGVIGNVAYCTRDPFGWIGNDFAHDAGRNLIKFFPPVRLPEFVLGVAMGRLYAARDALGLTARTGQGLVLLSCLVIAVGLMCSSIVPFALMHNVALSLPFAALTLGLSLAPASPLSSWLSRSSFVSLGEASYSVYILQAPIIWVFYLREAWSTSTNLPFAIGVRMVIIAAVVALAIASHRFLETPTRHWIRAYGRRVWAKRDVSLAN
jgi:peptidoglycan/LPS O-acetylase OafA/YrhL